MSVSTSYSQQYFLNSVLWFWETYYALATVWRVTALSLLTLAHNLQSVQTSYDPSSLHRCTQFAIPALYFTCTLCPDILALPSYLPFSSHYETAAIAVTMVLSNGLACALSAVLWLHSVCPLLFLITACTLYIALPLFPLHPAPLLLHIHSSLPHWPTMLLCSKIPPLFALTSRWDVQLLPAWLWSVSADLNISLH